MEELKKKILALKAEKKAVVFAHNYTLAEIQNLADFTGDSLELSIRARDAKAELIVFCGVSFMAETAKILSPNSRVLQPEPAAGCPMADMATAEAVASYRAEHPETVFVAYVNTTGAVKAEVDICCTSANAEKIISSIPPEKEIMFLPDGNLGRNIAKSLGRKMKFWPGYCPVHNAMTLKMVEENRRLHPGALLVVHPECPPEVVENADFSLSTGGMLRMLRNSSQKEFIIGTESGILHRMRKENPEKIFHSFSPERTCMDMKKITLDSLYAALRDEKYEVLLPASLMNRARSSIERMLAVV